jgi:hypothetical protein
MDNITTSNGLEVATKNGSMNVTDIPFTVDIWSLVAIIVFYIIIALIGIAAAIYERRQAHTQTHTATERAIVGARDLGLFVSVFTMIGN